MVSEFEFKQMKCSECPIVQYSILLNEKIFKHRNWKICEKNAVLVKMNCQVFAHQEVAVKKLSTLMIILNRRRVSNLVCLTFIGGMKGLQLEI